MYFIMKCIKVSVEERGEMIVKLHHLGHVHGREVCLALHLRINGDQSSRCSSGASGGGRRRADRSGGRITIEIGRIIATSSRGLSWTAAASLSSTVVCRLLLLLEHRPESIQPQYMASCLRHLQLLKLGSRFYASGGPWVGKSHRSAYSCTYSYPYSVPVGVVSSEIQ